jgi:CheY-like chemotaxis protein
MFAMSDKIALVIDDTPANREFLERLLTAAGFKVMGAGTAKEALDAAKGWQDLKLALIDMELPDMNGVMLTSLLRKQFPNAVLGVATMHDEVSLMESVFEKGGNIFLVKPHGFMELYKKLTTMDLAMLREGDPTVFDQFGPRSFSVATK